MRGPKHGGKTPRKGILEDFGFQPIKGDKARRYVQVSSGEVVSRRQAEKLAVGNFEKFAERNAQARPSPLTKYNKVVREYAEQKGIKVGEARKSADFKRSYAHLKNESKAKGPTIRRLTALHDLDFIDDATYELYMAAYMGEE